MSVELSLTLKQRNDFSRGRIDRVRARLNELGAGDILGENGVVYATGSMARGDASTHSDLDAFIISRKDGERRALSKLDSIRLKAKLIEVIREEGLPDFSDDGKFLTVHTIDEMLEKLGTAEDDYENLFTARMLLLLESVPLLGDVEYANVMRQVVEKYWKDYVGNEQAFLPIFLTNDVIRYWKVLCLNYEASTSNEPEPKRRHQNYKLKFSRVLTCYSAIVYLLFLVKRNERVTPEDALAMAGMKPLERLIAVAKAMNEDKIDASVTRLLSLYEGFLRTTDSPKDEIRSLFADDAYNASRREEATPFGDEMFNLMRHVGEDTPLYRYLVV